MDPKAIKAAQDHAARAATQQIRTALDAARRLAVQATHIVARMEQELARGDNSLDAVASAASAAATELSFLGASESVVRGAIAEAEGFLRDHRLLRNLQD